MNFKTRNNLYTSGDIKSEAKAQLSGNWGSAVLLALIPVLFSIFFLTRTADEVVNSSFAYNLLDLILEFIHAFLITGVSYALLDFLRSKNKGIETLRGVASPFQGKYFANLFLLKIVKYIFIFLWTLLLIIPGIVKAYAYSQAELIYKDTVDRTGEQPNPRDCLDESQRLMKGHKMDLFVLQFSFIGWVFLSILTIGILNLWLTPYMNMSYVVFYENISKGAYLNKRDKTTQKYEQEAPFGPREDIIDETNEEIGKDPDDFRDYEDY